ncbi:MAG TPA: tetratricopeptide repeat protein, partial [Candidatus Cloacimonas sp.]|nr:tetratricopeptide repeat protein [Candidatus Cloacimonas sp.]
MNKWILIACAALLILAGCTANRTVPTTKEVVPYEGITTKVAILPIKAMDSPSKYIQKMLTVRDLAYAFSSHPKYELQNMESVAAEFKMSGYKDVDDLELEDMKELATLTKCDVLAMGNITDVNGSVFAVAMRLYSARTGELRQLNFNLQKMKEDRWKTLDTALIGDLDKFVSTEVDKIYNIAMNFYAAGNYSESEKSLKMAMGLNPDLKDAQYYLGATYFKMGKIDLAVQNLEANLAKDPQHQQTLYMLMDIYDQTKQPLKRLAVMEKLATLNEDEELWLAIANLYAEQNNNAKAESALRSAIALKEDYAQAHLRLALLLYDQERYNDAIIPLEYTFDRFPENELVSRRLAVAYQKTNRLGDAVAKYEQLIKNNPNNVQAYLSVTNLYRTQAADATDPKIVAEIQQKAINTMNELKKVQPDNALAYLNLATIYLSQSKFSEVESNATLASQKDPTLYLPFVYLGTV